MKVIGVIGLTARQKLDLALSNLNCRFEFFNPETIAAKELDLSAGSCDHVVVPHGVVPPSIIAVIPSLKRVLLPEGCGVSTVISRLATLVGMKQPAGRMPPTQPKTHTHTLGVSGVSPPTVGGKSVPQSDPSQPEPAPPGWIGSLLIGHHSEYSRPNGVVVAMTVDSGGRFNHSILAAAKTGDVLRYPKDPSVSVEASDIKFLYVLREYSRKIGRAIEVHTFDKYVDVFVGSRPVAKDERIKVIRTSDWLVLLACWRNANNPKITTGKPPNEEEIQAGGGLFDGDVRRATETFRETASEAARKERLQKDADVPEVPVVRQPRWTPDDEAFWKEVFLMSKHQGMSTSSAALEARSSLDLLVALRNAK